MVMLFTIKNWRLTVIALMAAAVLIFPTLFPGGSSSLLPKAEATTYDITRDTTWGDKTLVYDDVVSISPGVTLTITGTVCCPGSFRVYGQGILSLNPGGVLTVSSGGILSIASGGTANIAGKLENFGSVSILSGAVLRVNEPGIFLNRESTSISGTLNINNGAEFDNYPSDGYIFIHDGGTLKVFTGGYLKNDGTIYKRCRGTLTLNPGASYTGNPIIGDSCIVINDVSLTEGNSGTKNFGFKVTRSVGTTDVTTLKFATVAGTASAAGNDYIAKSGTLTFTAGQTSKTVNIVVKGDTTIEPNETFNLKLSSCSYGSGECTFLDSKGVGTIKNDDGT